MKPTTWQIIPIHQPRLAPTHEPRYPKCVRREKIIQKYSVLSLVGRGRISGGGRVEPMLMIIPIPRALGLRPDSEQLRVTPPSYGFYSF